MTDHETEADLVRRAAELARSAHAGQYRRDGVTPYIQHPAAVALRVNGDARAESVAWLHDVLEDTALTPETLRQAAIPEEVIDCVLMLTKRPAIGYEQYLAQIKGNPLARKVKVADMLSNLSDDPNEKQILKYARGLLILLA